jgi:tetratricopeptide (TPR) repeat protein
MINFLLKIVIASVITGCFFASAQQPAKKSTGSTSEAEARRHYKIALAAMQNNDLETAEDELKKAAQLTPRNALIYYNLAVVAEKRGDVHAADESLAKAQQLHLPVDVKDQADTLRGEIDYKLQQEAKETAVQQETNKRLDAIKWLFRVWQADTDLNAIPQVYG